MRMESEPGMNPGLSILWRLAVLFLAATFFPFPSQGNSSPLQKNDRIVVLTFDDAVKSHRTFVAPLLQELGFGATFFVTHCWMNDKEHFMTWQEIAEIHEMGFEIGNHTWTHPGFNTPRRAAKMEGELALVENELRKVGVPKPVSFAWTGNGFGPEALEALRGLGYRLARRGMQPEVPYAMIKPGPLYDPAKHDPLLIPTAGDAYPDWSLEHFKNVVDRAGEAGIAVVQFHGVPDIAHPWVHTDPDRFRSFMQYLKEGGFRVVALRDVLPLVEAAGVPEDPVARMRYSYIPDSELPLPPEAAATRQGIATWLPVMEAHGYSREEMAEVCWLEPSQMADLIGSIPSASREGSLKQESDRPLVLPYPGGRHPRIGFLEGAIDPQRGTKASLFAPWEDGGYVVLDLPEAIFSNLGLTYLAHTHIPTIWDDQNIEIENVDWERLPEGGLRFQRTLPNRIGFGSEIRPVENGADLEMWLTNGTSETLTGLRTQVCAMLKGLPGFDEQTKARRTFDSPVTAIQSAQGDRWVLVAFDRCGRTWGNPLCPCIHSDPTFPDAQPGQSVSVKGRLWFYQGGEVEGEITRAKQAFSSLK